MTVHICLQDYTELWRLYMDIQCYTGLQRTVTKHDYVIYKAKQNYGPSNFVSLVNNSD